MTPAAGNPRATLETRSIDAHALRRFLADAEGDRVISPQVLGRLLGHATRHSHDGRIDVEVLTTEPHGGASCCRAAEEKFVRRLVREFRQKARVDDDAVAWTWKAAAGVALAASGMTFEDALPGSTPPRVRRPVEPTPHNPPEPDPPRS